jgi:hypothetical protein
MSNGITFPFFGPANTDTPAFLIEQSGSTATAAAICGVAVQKSGAGAEGILGLGRNGVHGVSGSPSDSGVWGENTNGGFGVSGSTNSQSAAGVWGDNQGTGQGVKGTSAGGDAILGISKSKDHSGVSAVNDSGGFGVWGRGTPAGHFEGNVEVTGQLKTYEFAVNGLSSIGGIVLIGGTVQLNNGVSIIGKVEITGDLNCDGNINIASGKDIVLADCAEEFDVRCAASIDPGTVMVIESDGSVEPSRQAYDKRVAGVVSGAGNCRPAIVLDRQSSGCDRVPVALLGKVYCKVDAQHAAIDIGDLLTTSPTVGHAMKAADPARSFGSVIGKALRPLAAGQALIPILIALQ